MSLLDQKYPWIALQILGVLFIIGIFNFTHIPYIVNIVIGIALFALGMKKYKDVGKALKT